MDLLPPIDVQFVATAVGVAALLAGLLLLWRWHRRRRLRAARALAITNCGYEHLRDVLVPDGQGSTLHVDFLLLTARGLGVIDLRDGLFRREGGRLAPVSRKLASEGRSSSPISRLICESSSSGIPSSPARAFSASTTSCISRHLSRSWRSPRMRLK